MVGFIDYTPALDDFAHKSITHLNSLLHLLGSTHQQIEWYYSHSVHYVIENYSRLSKRASFERHHNKQINVGLRARFAVSVRPEEHYLVGMKLKSNRATQQRELFSRLSHVRRLR